jgi:hypothetical protein
MLSAAQWNFVMGQFSEITGWLERNPDPPPNEAWEMLTKHGLQQTLLQLLADLLPASEDIQQEARRFGDLLPGEVASISEERAQAS